MPFTIKEVEAFVFRSPIKTPRRNAFGIVRERQALLVRVIDETGREGWGEGFANWPTFGAEYRGHYICNMIAPIIEGQTYETPEELFNFVSGKLRPLRLQTADHGAVDQAIAAVDIAVWDLYARQSEMPLWQVLGGISGAPVPVYASALTGDNLDKFLPAALADGLTSFKLKVGFGEAEDRDALGALRQKVGAGTQIMVDANQAWSPDEAAAKIAALADITGLFWVEEPISAESAPDVWHILADVCDVPLAAGENLFGASSYEPYLENAALTYLQPDIIKWGGLTGVHRMAKDMIARGYKVYPHYLGGGLGLMATAHLVASLGAESMLEFDVTENPFRELLAKPSERLLNGALSLGDDLGHGVIPDLSVLSKFGGKI